MTLPAVTMPGRVIALLLLLVLCSRAAAAWGPSGHQAVAIVAAARLTPAAQKEVSALLGGMPLPDVATWADDVRTDRPDTAPWHFTNIPITSSGFVRTRDCQQGACVVAAIERQMQILRDRSRPRQQRQEALKFLVHFVGDIHQPLHAGDNHDRGGNQRMMAMIGGATNLHAAWDTGVIQAGNRNAGSLAAAADAWLKTQNDQSVAGGSAVDWANESFRLARDIAYAQLKGDNAISGPERVEALRIIEKRIARAGERLAALLNGIFAAAE